LDQWRVKASEERSERGAKMKVSDIIVYETSDYGVFKKMIGNRSVNNRQVKKIIKSIGEVGVLPQPILVNEKMEVVDGQNRLEAFKRLDKSVLYIVKPGLGVKDCIQMNMNNTKWTVNDYIDCFADLGNENYIKLKQLAEMYPFSPSTIAAVTFKYLSSSGGACRLLVADGKYVVDDKTYEETTELLDRVMVFWNVLKPKGGRINPLFDAIRFMVSKDIDTKRMLEAVKKIPEFESFSTPDAYLKLFSEAYNRGIRNVENRIYLHTDFEKEKDRAKYYKNVRDEQRKKASLKGDIA